MYKSVVVLLIATLAIASYAKPRSAYSKVTYRVNNVNDDDITDNEIERDWSFNELTPREEKELSLVTNEVKPKKGGNPIPKPRPASELGPKEDEARPESGAPNSESKGEQGESSTVQSQVQTAPNSEQKGNRPEETKVNKGTDTLLQTDQPQPSNKKFIDFDKPPSSPGDYLMDMLYGFASWVYKKIFD